MQRIYVLLRMDQIQRFFQYEINQASALFIGELLQLSQLNMKSEYALVTEAIPVQSVKLALIQKHPKFFQ